jgi:hypothetical protein
MTDIIHTQAISDAAQKIGDGAYEMKAAVVDCGADAIQNVCLETERTLKANLFHTVLVAVSVGFILGAWVCRR